MNSQIRAELRDYIVRTWLSGDGRGFDDDSDLQQNGILDSFSTYVLIAFLDERFGIQLDAPDINAATFRSVGTIAELTMKKLGERRREAGHEIADGRRTDIR